MGGGGQGTSVCMGRIEDNLGVRREWKTTWQVTGVGDNCLSRIEDNLKSKGGGR